MRSGSTNNKINIEDDNDFDDDDDDDNNFSAHTFVHIHNKNHFQCHKIVSYIVADLRVRMEKPINCVINLVYYSRVWFFLSSHLTYYIRERHDIIFC